MDNQTIIFIRTKDDKLITELIKRKFITGTITHPVDDEPILLTMRSNIRLTILESYYIDLWDANHPKAAHIYTTIDDVFNITIG